jgi:hypothetical protein
MRSASYPSPTGSPTNSAEEAIKVIGIDREIRRYKIDGRREEVHRAPSVGPGVSERDGSRGDEEKRRDKVERGSRHAGAFLRPAM